MAPRLRPTHNAVGTGAIAIMAVDMAVGKERADGGGMMMTTDVKDVVIIVTTANARTVITMADGPIMHRFLL